MRRSNPRSGSIRWSGSTASMPDFSSCSGCTRRWRAATGSAYVYLPGHYLLPHSDSRQSEGRAIAYAYYVSAPRKGGELELFDCTMKKGEIVRTWPAKKIAPRANRLVLFAVTDTALHQVREVLRGARTSIAGWFYP